MPLHTLQFPSLVPSPLPLTFLRSFSLSLPRWATTWLTSSRIVRSFSGLYFFPAPPKMIFLPKFLRSSVLLGRFLKIALLGLEKVPGQLLKTSNRLTPQNTTMLMFAFSYMQNSRTRSEMSTQNSSTRNEVSILNGEIRNVLESLLPMQSDVKNLQTNVSDHIGHATSMYI